MYKAIIKTIFSLSISPVNCWKELANEREKDSQEFLSNFLYPLLGLTTFASFLGNLLHHKEMSIEFALKATSVTFVSLFAGFFLAAFLLNEAMKYFFGQKDDLSSSRLFVGYVSSCSYMILMAQALVPELFFLKFALLYLLYIIWIGSDHFMGIHEKHKIKFLIISTFVLAFSPYLVEKAMLILMPGLTVR